MPSLSFYPVFVGTFISVIGWLYLLRSKYRRSSPRTLSELAVDEGKLTYFRIVIWVCGLLFAITLILFISPRIKLAFLAYTGSFGLVLSEMLAGVFPARGKFDLLHNVLSYTMGLCMFFLAIIYAFSLSGSYAIIESIFAITMGGPWCRCYY